MCKLQMFISANTSYFSAASANLKKSSEDRRSTLGCLRGYMKPKRFSSVEESSVSGTISPLVQIRLEEKPRLGSPSSYGGYRTGRDHRIQI